MARASNSRRRRRRVVVGVVVAVVILALVGAGLLLRPSSSSASSYLTTTVKRADVAATVSASGSLVDQYTYSVVASGTPALTQLAGVATGSSSGASSSGSTSSSGSGSSGSGSSGSGSTTSGSGSASSSTGTSSSSSGSGDETTRSIAVSLGQKVAKDAKIAIARDSDDKDHTVKSPVAGHIRSITTAVGASASTVATVGAGAVLASVAVDENRVASVKGGQTVTLTLGSGGAKFTGTVRSIAQTPDGSSGVQQYQVLVTPDSIPTGSRIGMTVTASIGIDSRTDVLSVPAGAITTSKGRAAVRVLNARGALRTVQVDTGLVGDSSVEILDGVSVGQKVVTGTNGTVPATSTVQRPATN